MEMVKDFFKNCFKKGENTEGDILKLKIMKTQNGKPRAKLGLKLDHFGWVKPIQRFSIP
jgi:hypothetical protein